MGSNTKNISNLQQNFMTNVLEQNQDICAVTTRVDSSNNVVIANNLNVGNNFIGVNTNSAGTDASCTMVSTMDNSITSMLSAIVQQTNSTQTDLFGDFSANTLVNKVNIYQTASNNISQINQSTCTANLTQSANNNYVYYSGKVGGNFIGVNNDAGNTQTNCNMSNYMKNITYNQGQASGKNSNSYKGMFVAIVGSFAFIVGLMVIIVIFLFAIGAIGMTGYELTGSKKPKAEALTPEQETAKEEAALLGSSISTPDLLGSLSSVDLSGLVS